MTDRASESTALPPVDQRGVTTLSDRAWRRLAEATAVRSSTVPLTDARARVVDSGGRVRVDVDVVAPWRPPLARTASSVRTDLRNRLQQQSGSLVDAVNVHITGVDTGATAAAAPRASTDPALIDPPAPQVQAARPRRHLPPVLWLGILLPLALAALGLVAIREAFVTAGALDWQPWLEPWLGRPLIWSAGEPVVPLVAAGMLVLGLVLLVLSLRPGRRDSVLLVDEAGAWCRPVALARVASETAESVPGVIEASTDAVGRRVTVHVRVTSLDPVDDVMHAVTERLAPVTRPPVVRVRATALDGSRRSA